MAVDSELSVGRVEELVTSSEYDQTSPENSTKKPLIDVDQVLHFWRLCPCIL